MEKYGKILKYFVDNRDKPFPLGSDEVVYITDQDLVVKGGDKSLSFLREIILTKIANLETIIDDFNIVTRYGWGLNEFDDLDYDGMIGLVEMLQQVHAKNILHGDIKPENIVFISHKFELIDFGLGCNSLALPITNYTVYTSLYRAPEIYLHGEVTLAADLYALGMTMAKIILQQRSKIDLYNHPITQIFDHSTIGVFDRLEVPEEQLLDFNQTIKNLLRQIITPEEESIIFPLLQYDPRKREYGKSLHHVNRLRLLKQPQFIISKRRSIVVKWMIEVCQDLELSRYLIYSSVYLFDLITDMIDLSIDQIQLYAIASIVISVSLGFISSHPLSFDYIPYVTTEKYTYQQGIDATFDILNRLDYKVIIPSPVLTDDWLNDLASDQNFRYIYINNL